MMFTFCRHISLEAGDKSCSWDFFLGGGKIWIWGQNGISANVEDSDKDKHDSGKTSDYDTIKTMSVVEISIG